MARNKEFDRDEVLERAMHLFWEKGYNATSMQDLVDKLEINRSSLYNTFGEKHQLFLEALDRYRSQRAGLMIRMLHEAESPKAVLEQIFEMTVLEVLSPSEKKGCLMINTATELSACDNEAKTLVQRNLREVTNALAATIRRGQIKGEIKSTNDAVILAQFFANTLNGIRATATTGITAEMLRNIKEITFQAFW